MQRYIDKFINFLKIERNASGHTTLNYTIDLNAFASFLGDKDGSQVDHLTVRRYLAELKTKNYAKRTIARKLAASAALVTLATGVLVLFGWLLDIPSLKSVLPGFVAMKANIQEALAEMAGSGTASKADALAGKGTTEGGGSDPTGQTGGTMISNYTPAVI